MPPIGADYGLLPKNMFRERRHADRYFGVMILLLMIWLLIISFYMMSMIV